MNDKNNEIISEIIKLIQENRLDNNSDKILLAINEDIRNVDYLFHIAIDCADRGRIKEALKIFGCLTTASKILDQLYYNLGCLYAMVGNYRQAFRSFYDALEISPNDVDGLLNCANSLHELRRFEEAINYFDRALKLDPDNAQVLCNKGNTLRELGRYKDAIILYEKALFLNPDIDWLYGNYLYTKMKIGSWEGVADTLRKIARKVLENKKVSPPFALISLCSDPLILGKSAEIYQQDKCLPYSFVGPISKHQKKKKIRIAYFSPDFRAHPVSFLTAGLFEIHDRDHFEVFAFSLQSAPIDDAMNLRLRKGFDKFIDADAISDPEIAQLARKLEVDIAIDLAGLTAYSRTEIFSYRAAPIQVNWLGYPGTMGANFIDYIIADKTVIPESHQKYYSEKVVYLPNTYMVDDPKRIPSTRVFTRKECGLLESSFVFCCFNTDYKFNENLLDIWVRILIKIKNSVLWMSENNEYFKMNILSEFERRGINPSRIIFAKRVESIQDHLARYALADLFLDTFPYNAHSTAIDSLKAGVPVLTFLGDSYAGRVAASLLNAIDLPELIAANEKEYEVLAIELATNSQKLGQIRQKLVENRLKCPLFDATLFTQNLEKAYGEMMERYWKDLAPESVVID